MAPPTVTPTRLPGKHEPADLRLLVPAVSAWAVTFTVLHLGPEHRTLLLLLAAMAAAAALVLLVGTGRRPSATVLAAVLVTAAAATITTVLHTADLHRGPLPVLAHPPPMASAAESDGVPGRVPDAGPDPPAELSVDLTLAGDPKSHVSRTRGTAPGQSLLTISATVDRVTLPEPPTAIRTRTPVTVMVRAQDAPAWQGLLPSTRLSADVRVLPADDGSVSSAAVVLAHGPPRLLARPGLPQWVAGRLRAGLRAACDHLPPDTRGLLPGLVVGDTSRLPDGLHEAFRATDLGHLTAVSGANLAIILTVLIGTPARAGSPGRGGLAGLLGLPLRVTALLGTALTLAFVTVCRPDPSVLRAAATGLIGLLALATGRPRQALPALSAAALVLILLDPYLARSYGFVLSVLATTGLLTLGPRWTAALLRRGWPHRLATAVAATAAAQALCAPVTILLAPRISLVAVPCNLLAELAVAPATLLGFAALSIDPFSRAAARLLADLAALPAGWLAAVARHGAALPGAQLAWPGGLFGAVTLALTTLALGWAARPFLASSRRSDRSHVRAALAAALGLALLVVLLRPPLLTRIATGWPPPGWRFVMCDIGQGDMTVLPLSSDPGGVPDSAIVVDAGPDPGAADTCLRDLGITRIALLIISHFHADHAEGLPGVLHGRSIGALQVTTLDAPPGEHARVLGWAADARVPVLRAQRGEHRSAGPQLSWDVLWPDGQLGPATPGANNASIALLATVGPPEDPLRIALLGDLEPPAQAALRAYLRPPRVDILKVAHHGSSNQDWDLIDALHPRLALISCGVDNPYGHPSSHTVSRLGALGSAVLRTDRSGDIAVLGTPTDLRAATHPRERRHSQGLRAPRPRPPPS
ncbi:ComEC/Rec2 family competence protein [Kitasatospora atroaurantiaca]|uniref:Competence protein ComEC n=1 Tax=Kitasatospora atroaurantiaca TaxID=285545 RepID=A0A561ENV2_9ACTN|nr:ComEC/Rec2 family competence protein [Kitasatospora atroaurantiaca]TWE17298.1 competence protein ComEC [Kitasatospora atroaurantiaca]